MPAKVYATANPAPARPVLALNAGSSSLKFGLHRVSSSSSQLLLAGEEKLPAEPGAVLTRIAALLTARKLPAPAAIGHRFVHGGRQCRHHTVIDAAVLQQLQAAAAFAPLHVPSALAMVGYAQQQFPDVPQVACLDTAFHAAMPAIARTLPIPQALRSLGVERYGFHGLSCESIVRQLGLRVPQRLVIAHLGHGASVTAVRDGHSIDTSMGLTPSGGVMMSTRCGDIDPGVLTFAVRELRLDGAQLEGLIDERSGMMGVSGLSGDLRELRVAAATNPAAQLAIDMFCYSVRKQIAAMAAVLGGVDLLIFTGGIGEHDAAARAAICVGLGALGIPLDPDHTLVLPAQEDWQIAYHTWRLMT